GRGDKGGGGPLCPPSLPVDMGRTGRSAPTTVSPIRYIPRPMSLEVGIVGLPNVGKSTIFNALTAAGALAANYPFATIEPNVGVVDVPDPRLDTILQFIASAKKIPAPSRLVHTAGTVRGPSVSARLGDK